MFIQTEETPNPEAIKFLPGVEISSVPIFFDDFKKARERSSLAAKIYDVGNVKAVFFGFDFITVTKDSSMDWKLLKPEILMVIMDHIVAGLPIFDKSDDDKIDLRGFPENDGDISGIEKEIVEIIENRVRPSVAMDGGDIVYKGFKDGVVYLQLQGACSGCPSSGVTLKNGIESMLQHFVPEVKSVKSVE